MIRIAKQSEAIDAAPVATVGGELVTFAELRIAFVDGIVRRELSRDPTGVYQGMLQDLTGSGPIPPEPGLCRTASTA